MKTSILPDTSGILPHLASPYKGEELLIGSLWQTKSVIQGLPTENLEESIK